MKGSDVDLTQGKVTAYCAEGTDYFSQLPYQRKQEFGADNRETEFNFYGVETTRQNKTGKIVQQAQVASEQLLWGGPASYSG
jgi:hypothetical protein